MAMSSVTQPIDGQDVSGRLGIVLFSGGTDSTLVCLLLASRGAHLIGLSINYPGRPYREVETARAMSSSLSFDQFVEAEIDIGVPMMVSEYHSTSHEGWIPFRNLLFWTIGAQVAHQLGATFVAAGHEPPDARTYSDASRPFFRSLGRSLTFTGRINSQPPDIVVPFLAMRKSDQLALAETHIEVLDKTWSCWRGGPSPCGNCHACRTREEFLLLARSAHKPRGRSSKPND